MPNYKYDVFISYHGTYDVSGTYSQAKNIANYLRKANYSVYLFEEEEGETWSSTPRHVIESKAMLVVLNDGVLLDENGLISKMRTLTSTNRSEPYQLYAEIDEFKKQVNCGNKNPQVINFIYCGKEYNTREEARRFCAHQADGIESLNNIIGSDCDLNSENPNYEIILNWLKSAIKITDAWDVANIDKNINVKDKSVDDFMTEIEDEMYSQNCVAVLGPLVSECYSRFGAGEGKTFFEKCFYLYNKNAFLLEDELKKQFDRGEISNSLQQLVKLPFNAYLSTAKFLNIDEALKRAGIAHKDISKEEDIFGLDLQHGQIPVFNLSTSKIWEDDCLVPDVAVCAMLKMLLRGRRIIYIGYDNYYDGYKRIGKMLRGLLGEGFFTVANNFAIVYDQTKPALYEDTENHFTVINLAVKDFINKIISNNELFQKMFRVEDIDNQFVTQLFSIASSPTETQAIKLLLQQVREDISKKQQSVKDIVDKYDVNVRYLKKIKPNFNAFEKFWNDIKGEVDYDTDYNDLELIISQKQTDRLSITNGIRKQGKNTLTSPNGARILIYSQSLRVVEYLCGAQQNFKKSSTLFICECRPKSDTPFRDAKNMCEIIKQEKGDYKSITIIPDMAAFNLMERGLIDIIVLGAHDVVLHNGAPLSFINTCGSIALMAMAKKNNIPVIVVAEKGKFTEAEIDEMSTDGQLKYSISYGQESTIFMDLKFVKWAKKENIGTQNIGYDFCRFYEGVKLVNEYECIVCKNSNVKVRLVQNPKDEKQ